MNEPQNSPNLTPQAKKPLTLLAIIIPLGSCLLTSFVGIIIGQVGNLIYSVLGDAAGCLSVPGFIGLFLFTFALSFFSHKLLKKWLSGLNK